VRCLGRYLEGFGDAVDFGGDVVEGAPQRRGAALMGSCVGHDGGQEPVVDQRALPNAMVFVAEGVGVRAMSPCRRRHRRL